MQQKQVVDHFIPKSSLDYSKASNHQATRHTCKKSQGLTKAQQQCWAC